MFAAIARSAAARLGLAILTYGLQSYLNAAVPGDVLRRGGRRDGGSSGGAGLG